MMRLFEIFLEKYNQEDRELFLKARFVFSATLFMIVTMIAIVVYTYYIAGGISRIVLIESAGFVIITGALALLVKGFYHAATHIIFTTAFGVAWSVIFIEPYVSPVAKLDTIVFIPALLAAMPLMLFKDRKPILIYFLVNIILFLCFNYYIYRYMGLATLAHLDYFLDNLVSILFVFFVSFTLFTIYRQALISLKKELADRKKVEKALQESEYRLSAHLLNTPVGAVSWDMDLKVTEWNPSAERIFGYKKSEAAGRHVADLILPPDAVAQVNGVFERLLSGRGGKRSVNENVTKSGKRIICDWYNTTLEDNKGRIIGVASLVNDITEAKKTQEIMIQTEKMMSVGGLAAGMAHEINNPLAGMMQSAQVIRNRLTQDLKANIRAADEHGISMDSIRSYIESRGVVDQLNNIHSAGRRAARIIRNMLSFSRQSSSQRTQVNFVELVNAAIELAQNDYNLKKQYDFKNIRVSREYDPDLPDVFCEGTKIEQVVFNLLKNASQAMGEPGSQADPKIVIRLRKGYRSVQMEIEDNGPGMDEETRKRIFEPFFTTKSVDNGTGLGLSVSYFIVVDDHGGKMSVESVPGEGAKFMINLPVDSRG